MFKHNFKYTLKTLFKNKDLIFWTFAFPIILGTLFNMAFSNISNSEKLKPFDIAIVNNESYEKNNVFKETFKVLSDDNNKDKLFNIEYVTEEQADKLLENKKITGYIILNNDEYKITISSNGVNSTILKYVTEEVLQTSKIFNNLVSKNIEKEIKSGNTNIDYQKIYQSVYEIIEKNNSSISDASSDNLNYMMIPFYTLIAMTCLYGGMLGLVVVNQNLPNMSSNGKRVSVSPVSKSKIIFSGVLASYLVQIIGIMILFIYTKFILKIDYGDNMFLVILLTLVGCLAGLSLGVLVSSIVKSNENLKTGLIISITMLGCFLSGMMALDVKYFIDKNMPIINMINPANMITDGYYSLYYYTTLDKFYFSFISLIIFSVVLIAISIFSLRRQKYDSI